jgi:hypothetical protein
VTLVERLRDLTFPIENDDRLKAANRVEELEGVLQKIRECGYIGCADCLADIDDALTGASSPPCEAP